MKQHLLLVIPKWCDAKPELGFTNDFHNLINTVTQSAPNFVIHTLHTDECLMYGAKLDDMVIKYCRDNKISVVIYSLICNMPQYNPSVECFKTLKAEGVKQCIIWPDTGPIWGMETIDSIADSVDLHVSIDCPRSHFHTSKKRQPNHIDLWTPEDQSMFFFYQRKDIDVAFLGSINLYQDRIFFLSSLQQLGVNVAVAGGQRSSGFTPYQYAGLVKRSKIIINFPLSQTGIFFQAKGRIFETAACGGLLFDMNNPSTNTFFKPGESYVDFSTPEDLKAKVEYYLSHEEERNKISIKASQIFYENYTALHFWTQVFARLKV